MLLARAPAAAVALFLLAGAATAPQLEKLEIPLLGALVALAAALGGRPGALLAAGTLGLGFGSTAPSPLPLRAPIVVAQVEGRICSFWTGREHDPMRSARLCPRFVRRGSEVELAPEPLRISIPIAVELPAFGAAIAARGVLDRFPGFANEQGSRPGPWRLRVKSGWHLRTIAPPDPLARASGAIRRRIDDALSACCQRRSPGWVLARSFVLGDDSSLSEERRRAFRRVGLAHLLAVSGFNLTLVCAFVALVAGAGSRRRAVLLPAAAIALYLGAVGPEPSLLRATITVGIALVCSAVGRPSEPLQALSLAALLLVALDPDAVRDPGFQLSFGATSGLVLFAGRWRAAFAPLPRFLAAGLAASFGAQAGALPWSVAAFGTVAPMAPLLDLVAVPWAALWIVVTLAWTLLACLWPQGAGATVGLLDVGAWPFAWIEELPASSWVSFSVARNLGAGLIAAALVVATLEALRRGAGRAVVLSGLLLLLAPRSPSEDQAEITFVDVGQGDAAIVRSGAFTLLVDGGGSPGRDVGSEVLRPLLSARGISRVDLAIVSHVHADHCLGLLDLTALLPIDELVLPPGGERTECGGRLAARVRRLVPAVARGVRLERPGLTVTILHPGAQATGRDPNQSSIVARVELGGRSILFAADISAIEEAELVRSSGGSLKSDVLKVAHHGSASASSPAFLAAVGARIAIVSAGIRNPFGHPSNAVLTRLHESGALILRTDRDGQVTLQRTESGGWRIHLPASPREGLPSS